MLMDWSFARVGPRLERFFERVADVVRPDPPMGIRTLDGQLLTGVVIVDRGQVIAFLGSRQSAPPSSPPWRPYDHDEEPLMGYRHGPYSR
jgi:hypothetical protein